MNKSLLIASALGAVLLAACGPKEAAPEPAKTVSYYVAHPAERREKVTWCRDDGKRGLQDECLNAEKAIERAMFEPTPAPSSAATGK